jgi:hypothetical protein
MRRRRLISIATATGASTAFRACAGLAGAMGLGIRRASARAAYPSRTLTLIVPVSPGSSVGINARLLHPYLERALGQSLRCYSVRAREASWATCWVRRRPRMATR